jgi:hypothetical protein
VLVSSLTAAAAKQLDSVGLRVMYYNLPCCCCCLMLCQLHILRVRLVIKIALATQAL